VFAQALDIPAWKAAYLESRWVDVYHDEELRENIAEEMGLEYNQLLALIKALPAQIQTDSAIGDWGNHLSELRALSASLCVIGGDPFGDSFQEQLFSASPAKAFKLQVLVEFSTPEAAASAWADALKEMGKSELPDCKVDGAIVVIRYGELKLGAELGPVMKERWGTLGAELSEPQGTALLEAYCSLGDQPLQWAESYVGYSGVEGPLGQMFTAAIGAPFLALARGGAWRVTAKDGEFHTSGRYSHRAQSNVDEVFGSIPLTQEDLAFVHPDARVAGAISVDREALLPWAQSLVEFLGAAKQPEAFEERFGFNPLRDLVAPLGASIQWSLQGNLRLGVPPCQLTARVTDEAAMQRGLQGLARWAVATFPDGIEAKTLTYQKTELITFRSKGTALIPGTPSFDPATLITPTVAVVKGRLLLAPNGTLAKREIKRILQGETDSNPLLGILSRHPNFKQSGAVSTGDWMFLLARLAKLAKTTAKMNPMQGEEFGISRLPDLFLASRHFAPSVEIQTRSKTCMHYESRSHVGPESLAGLFLGIGLAATQVVPRILERLDDAKVGRCKAEIAALGGALRSYAIKNGGEYPDSLQQLVEKDSNGRSFLEQETLPLDAWGKPYHYDPNAPDGGPSVWSSGPNQIDEQGQGDDLTYEDLLSRKW